MSTATNYARGELRRDLTVLALLAACVFLPALGRRDLWNPDEPRYAEVAREMRATGEYVVPHFNGRIYTEKPPLLFWAMATSGFLLGDFDELAARLPSALAAIGSVLLIYGLGRSLFDRRAGWLAAIVFATCSKILWQARVGQIDMLLTFLVLCGVFFWSKGRLENRPALSYLFFAFAGLATLAKGPVGLLPPLLSILAFLAVTRDRQGLRDLRVGRGLLIWAGVVLLWLVPAILGGGDAYSDDILLRQNVTRYVDPWGHHQPPWYFLEVMLADFLPWSLLVPAAVVAGRSLDARQRKHLLLMACWVAVTVLFFSVSPGKRSVYVLTCYPALALATGAGLAAITRRDRPGRGWLAWPVGAWTLLLWAVALVLPSAARFTEVPAFAAPLLAPVAIGFGALAATSTVALVFAVRRRALAMAVTLAAGMAVGALVLQVFVLPRLDPELSQRGLAATIARDLPPGTALASLHEMEGGLLFYGSPFVRELEDVDELLVFMAEHDAVWVIVDPDNRRELARLPDLRVVARQGERDDGVRILASP